MRRNGTPSRSVAILRTYSGGVAGDLQALDTSARNFAPLSSAAFGASSKLVQDADHVFGLPNPVPAATGDLVEYLRVHQPIDRDLRVGAGDLEGRSDKLAVDDRLTKKEVDQPVHS